MTFPGQTVKAFMRMMCEVQLGSCLISVQFVARILVFGLCLFGIRL